MCLLSDPLRINVTEVYLRHTFFLTLYNFFGSPLILNLLSLLLVHKSSAKLKHLALVDALWSLLPAFCRRPTDLIDNFGLLTNILVEKLKKDPSSHNLVFTAIEVTAPGIYKHNQLSFSMFLFRYSAFSFFRSLSWRTKIISRVIIPDHLSS